MSKIDDPIYGSFELHPVIQEIINDESFQRFKHMEQGAVHYLIDKKWHINRHAHAIGTMLLIKKLGGDLEEQIAALIQNIAYTSNSHASELVFDHLSEQGHDLMWRQTLSLSNIPNILEKYGYSLNAIAHAKEKPILNQPLPGLCATRIDYTIKDLYRWEKIAQEEIHTFLSSLCVINGQIIIQDPAIAIWFVKAYDIEVNEYFVHPMNLYAYEEIARLLRYAIHVGMIEKNPSKDPAILKKLRNKHFRPIISGLERLMKTPPGVFVGKEKDGHIYLDFSPPMVDPYVLVDKALKKSSEISDLVKTLKNRYRWRIYTGVFVKSLILEPLPLCGNT